MQKEELKAFLNSYNLKEKSKPPVRG